MSRAEPEPDAPVSPDAAPPAPPTRLGTTRLLTQAVILLATLAVLAVAVAARGVLIPILLAALGALLLAPAVRALLWLRLPRAVAAALVLLLALGAVVGLLFTVAEPAQEWLERAPRAVQRIERAMNAANRPLEAASQATESLMQLSEGRRRSGQPATVAVATRESPLQIALRGTPALFTSIFAALFLTFLLLVYGDAQLRKTVSLMPRLSAKKHVVAVLRSAQAELSRYLATISMINMALGACTAAALWWIGLPDPLLWGGVVALLNFAPYVGPALAAALLLLAGFAHFDAPAQALLPPGLFLLLHGFEGQLITPVLVGRRLALDPVVIFVGLLVSGWMWGIAGLLLAVPLLACLRILACRLAPEGVAARVLGR